jgi:hypothetical protein
MPHDSHPSLISTTPPMRPSKMRRVARGDAFLENFANACLEKPLDAEPIREVVRREPPGRTEKGDPS